MISGWILILVLNGAYQTKMVAMQEFNTKDNCEFALQQISSQVKTDFVKCVMK